MNAPTKKLLLATKENSAVLFLLLYDYVAVKQQQRDLAKGISMDMQLNPEQQIQGSSPQVYMT